MNKLSKFQLFFIIIMLSFSFVMMYNVMSSSPSASQTYDVESMTVSRLDSSSALVTFYHHNTQDELYVEIEYPEEGVSLDEQLSYNIGYAVAELKQLCNH